MTDRIGRFRKGDVLFLVGVGLIVYGGIVRAPEIIVAGIGVTGYPITQRMESK